MPLSYTNRCGKTGFFRAVQTAKGGTRYYITKSDNFPNLIESIPEGFEIYEDPYEGRIILRKIVPCLVLKEEIATVKKAVETLSALKDIIIEGEDRAIIVWHSHFNYIAGDDENLSAEEAVEALGEHVNTWKRYDDNFKFVLVDAEKRLFQAERKVLLSLAGNSYMPLKKGKGSLKKLTEHFCPYMGRSTYFDTVPEGFDN